LTAVRALLTDASGIDNETVDLRGANGHWQVWLAGCHNHRAPGITELFRSIARAAPGSYGILYVYDDEASDGWDRWVMRRGDVHKARDEDLSPHVGVVEDAYDHGQPD
jgi:Immunity protein 7